MRLVLLFALLAMFSCRTPQQLIDKAVKKDPTILQPDTIVTTVPQIILDTVVQVKRDTTRVEADVDSIINSLDLPDICDSVMEPVVDYVISYRFLSDSVSINEVVSNDSVSVVVTGSVRVTPDSIYLNVRVGEATIKQSVQTVSVVKDPSWLNRTYEIILFAFVAFLLFMLYAFVVRK